MKQARARNTGIALLLQPERVEAALWRQFRSSGQGQLRQGLFERYRRFAASLARRHARRNDLASDILDDLEQSAYRGLLEAIDRFDPLRGYSFLTFAAARIAGSIVDGQAKLNEVSAQQRFRRRVERERLASLTHTDRERKSATEQLAIIVAELALGLMLDAEERRDGGTLTGTADNGFDNLAWRQTQSLLHQRVEDLPEPERTVIKQHYQNDLRFAQIATMLGLSRGRIAQLHKVALGKLRKAMRTIR